MLTLSVSNAIFTRTQLASIRSNPTQEQGRDVNQIRTKLTSVAPHTLKPWRIRFVAEQIFSNQGVYAVGVHAISDSLSSHRYTTLPWFGKSQAFRPTKVMLLVPVTTLATRLTKKVKPPTTQEITEVSRLHHLTEGLVGTKLSAIVDPSVNDWTKRFSTQDATSANVQEITNLKTNLEVLSGTSANLPYGNANLAALVASGKSSELKGIKDVVGSTNGTTLFRAPLGNLDERTLNLLVSQGITPILRNESISGTVRTTTPALSSIAKKTVIISDTAASQCFQDVTSNSSFSLVSSCLLSEIGMMTAESPGLPRTVSVIAPNFWNISTAYLRKLNSCFTTWSGTELISLKSVLQAQPIPVTDLTYGKPFPTSAKITSQATQLASQTNLVASLIANRDWARQFRKARYIGYSVNWSSKALNLNYLQTLNHQLATMADSVQIQAAGRVTVSTNKTDVPITIANFGQYPAHVRVRLTSNSPGQLSSEPSALHDIPVGQRVTIPLQVEVKGTGVIHATAVILNPRGQQLGDAKNIDISATAYQKIASAVVKFAFGLLLLLAVNNFIRRRRPTKIKVQP